MKSLGPAVVAICGSLPSCPRSRLCISVLTRMLLQSYARAQFKHGSLIECEEKLRIVDEEKAQLKEEKDRLKEMNDRLIEQLAAAFREAPDPTQQVPLLKR